MTKDPLCSPEQLGLIQERIANLSADERKFINALYLDFYLTSSGLLTKTEVDMRNIVQIMHSLRDAGLIGCVRLGPHIINHLTLPSRAVLAKLEL